MTINDHISAIRNAALNLPNGKKNQVLNRCDRISVILKKEQQAIIDRDAVHKQIVAALLTGRVLSYKNQDEFMTSQFHTAIVYARQIVERRFPEYTFRSKWVTGEGHPYKIYWIDKI